jgi:hypothetical protein
MVHYQCCLIDHQRLPIFSGMFWFRISHRSQGRPQNTF